MGTLTINGMTSTSSAASGDFIAIWVAASGFMRKITKANLLGITATGGGTIATGGFTLTVSGTSTINGSLVGNMTGSGTVATGGFTLTVPATGTAVLLATTQTISGNKTFSGTNTHSGVATFDNLVAINNSLTVTALVGVVATPSSGVAQMIVKSNVNTRTALRVDIPSSPSAPLVSLAVNGVQRGGFNYTDTASNIFHDAVDLGTGRGTTFYAPRNNNASTPAAGNILLDRLNGTAYYIWPDNSANLRIGTTAPNNANDTSGTVVGTQTSMAAAKDIDEALPDWRASLAHVREAVQNGALRSWRYKEGSYNNEHFPIGLVTDLASRYGMDRAKDAPNGRSLNIPVAIGDLFAAVALLAEQLEGKSHDD